MFLPLLGCEGLGEEKGWRLEVLGGVVETLWVCFCVVR
jgi:hypothetical protein